MKTFEEFYESRKTYEIYVGDFKSQLVYSLISDAERAGIMARGPYGINSYIKLSGEPVKVLKFIQDNYDKDVDAEELARWED